MATPMAQPTVKDASPFASWKVDHAAIRVPDFDGFIFELLAGPGAVGRPTYTDLHDSYKMAGWHHVCFRVDSVDAAIEQLKHRAVTVVSEPHDVVAMRLRVAFFADPWGNLFEFTQSLGDRS